MNRTVEEAEYTLEMRHLIRNFDALATTPLREAALAIAEAAYSAIDVRTAFAEKVQLRGDTLVVEGREIAIASRHLSFIGIGKCAVRGAQAVEALLGEKLTAGIAFDVASYEDTALQKVEVLVGTHPEPSEINMRATEKILSFLAEKTVDDLVIMLISGGGSTLLCAPQGATVKECLDERILFDELTSRGATIQELNTVRKHISKARGGGLAAAAYPAEVLSFVVSDVPGDELEFIASGPTVLDSTTVDDAHSVLTTYDLVPPANVALSETPKEAHLFEKVTNVLLVTNARALAAMEKEAHAHGLAARVVDAGYHGEAQAMGASVLEELRTAPAKTALLYAGESTVTLRTGSGKGGRNQELALSVLDDIDENALILPFASDGHDNTDRAGAIADTVTKAHAAEQGLSTADALASHASYDFFTTTGDFLNTGETGSNVSDLIIAIKK